MTNSAGTVDWVSMYARRLSRINSTLENYVLLMKRPPSKLVITISSDDLDFIEKCYESRVASIRGMCQNFRVTPTGVYFHRYLLKGHQP